MPYRLTWEGDAGVYREYYGDISIAERRKSLEAICGDSRFDNLRYSITDSLAVGSYEFTPEGSAEIAALHIGPLLTNPGIVMSAVAVRADIVEAIRCFKRQGFTSNPYEIFPTVVAARIWIDAELRKERRTLPMGRW